MSGSEISGKPTRPQLSQARYLDELDQTEIQRDSRLTVQLTNEHRAITHEMERLTTGQLEIDGLSYGTTSCIKLAESLSEHFRREEQFLFPILDRSLGSATCDRLKGEHAEIMNTVKKLNQQINPLKESFNHLERMFRAHISTEENVLFWYLDLQEPTQ